MGYQIIPAHGAEPEHVHLDMAYALVAHSAHDPEANLAEVEGARWMTKDEIIASDVVVDAVTGFARAYMS